MEVVFLQTQIGQFLDQSQMQMRFCDLNIQNLITFLGILRTLSHSIPRALSLTTAQICHSALESIFAYRYKYTSLSFFCELDGPADKSARRVVQHTQRTISQLGRARTLVCTASQQ